MLLVLIYKFDNIEIKQLFMQKYKNTFKIKLSLLIIYSFRLKKRLSIKKMNKLIINEDNRKK